MSTLRTLVRRFGFASIAVLAVNCAHCAHVENSPCDITPPKVATSETSTAQKLTADLSKLAVAPINAGLSNEYTQKINITYDSISDKDKACEIILRAYTCTIQRRDKGANELASGLIGVVTTKCGAPGEKPAESKSPQQ